MSEITEPQPIADIAGEQFRIVINPGTDKVLNVGSRVVSISEGMAQRAGTDVVEQIAASWTTEVADLTAVFESGAQLPKDQMSLVNSIYDATVACFIGSSTEIQTAMADSIGRMIDSRLSRWIGDQQLDSKKVIMSVHDIVRSQRLHNGDSYIRGFRRASLVSQVGRRDYEPPAALAM